MGNTIGNLLFEHFARVGRGVSRHGDLLSVEKQRNGARAGDIVVGEIDRTGLTDGLFGVNGRNLDLAP